jgi:hypothetical protein
MPDIASASVAAVHEPPTMGIVKMPDRRSEPSVFGRT